MQEDPRELIVARAVDFLCKIIRLQINIEQNNAVECVRILGRINFIVWQMKSHLQSEMIDDADTILLANKIESILDIIQSGLAVDERSVGMIEDGYYFWVQYERIFEMASLLQSQLKWITSPNLSNGIRDRNQIKVTALEGRYKMENLLNKHYHYFNPETGILEKRSPDE